jgi:hypothetical protein
MNSPSGSEPEDEQTPERSGLTWLVGAVFMFVLYVLSIGPVVALNKSKPVTSLNAIRQVYFPVIWLHDHTALKGPLDAYARLWGWN